MRRIALALIACVLLAGCGGGSSDDAAPPPQAGTGPARAANPVDSITETFVDASRPTREHGPFPATPTRVIRTTVVFPAPGAGGPYPLVVFAHGSGGLGTRYSPLLQSWAVQGYVVATPVFPFAADGELPDGTSTEDLANQPADMTFVITELLRLNGDASSPLKGLIDPARIGAAGHSLGGMTTLAVAANTCCYDQRVKAAVILAGREQPFGSGTFFTRIRTPILLVHGDADPNVAYRDGRKAYADAPPPRFLVTLLGGDHSSLYDPFDGPAAQVTARVTLDFFDSYLRGDAGGVARLIADANAPGVAKLESET